MNNLASITNTNQPETFVIIRFYVDREQMAPCSLQLLLIQNWINWRWTATGLPIQVILIFFYSTALYCSASLSSASEATEVAMRFSTVYCFSMTLIRMSSTYLKYITPHRLKKITVCRHNLFGFQSLIVPKGNKDMQKFFQLNRTHFLNVCISYCSDLQQSPYKLSWKERHTQHMARKPKSEEFRSWWVNLGGMAANHCHSCEGDGMIVLWVQYTHDYDHVHVCLHSIWFDQNCSNDTVWGILSC